MIPEDASAFTVNRRQSPLRGALTDKEAGIRHIRVYGRGGSL
jgi:hypothetical protein